jgi:glycosyltransferase involved in cell wall biosynthesis
MIGAAALRSAPVRRALAPIRLCVLAETFHPVVGGGETQARLLAEQLVQRGYRVTVLTRRSSRELTRHDALGEIEICRLGPSGPGGNKRWPMLPVVARELWRRRGQMDLLLVLGFRALGLAALAARGVLGVPCIFKAESTGEASGDFFGPGLRRLGLTPTHSGVNSLVRARNRIFRRADAFVALSVAMKREFVQAGFPATRIRRIPNGVDTEVFRPASPQTRAEIRRSLGFGPAETLVTYTGRLVSYKGLPLLLRVWQDIARDVRNARLVLVGEGGGDIHNCEAELRAFVAAQAMEGQVIFTGAVDRVERLLQASDIFVFPTQNEAFGLSLVEAMACGLPCIATSVGGVPDILTHRHDGLMISAGDGAALRDALRRLLGEPGLARQLALRARQTAVERFSADATAGAYAELIETLARPRS